MHYLVFWNILPKKDTNSNDYKFVGTISYSINWAGVETRGPLFNPYPMKTVMKLQYLYFKYNNSN